MEREGDWSRLFDYAERRRFRAGELLIRAGDVERSLLIIGEGELEVLLPDGGDRRMGVVQPGEVIGEIAFFDGSPRSASVRATIDGEARVLSREKHSTCSPPTSRCWRVRCCWSWAACWRRGYALSRARAERRRGRRAAQGDCMSPASPFLNYMQLPRRVPLQVWFVIRYTAVGLCLVLCLLLVVRPRDGLTVFWGVVIPILPIVFFVAPGFWRNTCPLAAMNQAPRVFGLPAA